MQRDSSRVYPVVRDFVGARAINDLFLECVEFYGYSLNRYSRFGLYYWRLTQIFQLGAPMICVVFMVVDSIPDIFQVEYKLYKFLLSIIIFQHWYRVSYCFRNLQKLAFQILPITLCLERTMPALFLSVVIFLGLLQSLWVYAEAEQDPEQGHFYDTFGFLVTQDYYEDMGSGTGAFGRDPMRLLALTLFSVIVLNIFIGVITEAYEIEKETVKQRLWSMRANGCASYFARKRTWLFRRCRLPQWQSYLLQFVVGGGLLVFQLVLRMEEGNYSFLGIRIPQLVPQVVFIVGIFVLHVATFQDGDAPWHKQELFLWMMKKRRDADVSTALH